MYDYDMNYDAYHEYQDLKRVHDFEARLELREVCEDLRLKNEFAMREREQERLAFLSDPDFLN